MNRCVLALVIGASTIIACSPTVSPNSNDDTQQALDQGVNDKGDGSDQGDPGKDDPGKGDPGKGDPGKGGCDGGGGKGPGDGGSCVVTKIDGCIPIDEAKQLASDKCRPGFDVTDVELGDACGPLAVDGLSFTCCQMPPTPPSTCSKFEVSDLCTDDLALKGYYEKCDAGLILPPDLCAPDALIVCCVADATEPPPKK